MKRVALLLLVLVAGCSDDDGDDDKAATTTTTTAATTTSATAPDAACFTFEEVDRGASVTVFAVHDCDGAALTLDGEPAAFPVGGTVTHAEGLRCEDDRLVALSAVSDDGQTYQAVETIYVLEGGELVRTEAAGATLSAEEVQPYYEIDC